MITEERLYWILVAIERNRLSAKEKELLGRFEELGPEGVELNQAILEDWNKDVEPDKRDESLSDALERIFRECILREPREGRRVEEWID